jgi:outer membrane protein OmpA-like peptidoglycan-associated protein
MQHRMFVPLAVAGALLLAAGCSGGDDDAPTEQAADVAGSDRSTSITTDVGASGDAAGEDSGEDSGEGGSGSGSGTDLESSQSDASSDLERRVSETLSDLDAGVVDGDTVIVLPEQVLFDFDQYQLLPDAAATLDRIAEAINYFAGAPVQVNGHTDSRGAPDYNQQLSERRAQAVVDHLTGAGVDGGRLTPQGFGETQPVAPNENQDGSDNPDGRAQNRRVEIVIEGVDPADVGD